MARYELKLPQMGESVAEATVTNWLKEVGDEIEEDEAVLEIATDKVDSEVPSEVDGVLKEILFEVDDVVKVGETIAIIETEGEEAEESDSTEESASDVAKDKKPAAAMEPSPSGSSQETAAQDYSEASRFYSPLVKS